MTISLDDSRPATPREWDEIWAACSYATFFHSRAWADAWSAYTGRALQAAPLLVRFSDRKRALLPLSRRRGLMGLVRRYVSSPARTYGGWISADELTNVHADLLHGILNRLPNLTWRVNPYDPQQAPRGPVTRSDDTSVVRLEGGFEAVYKKWSKGHRAAARQAARLGATIRVASGVDDWHAYYEVYRDSLRRWGSKATSRYRRQFFELLGAAASPHIRLWLATHEKTIIAGALCFYAAKHVSYWHGAALEQYFHVRPANLLMYEAMKHACDEGYVWFDFNPSGRHEGVRAFKRSFGTESLSCPVIVREGRLPRAVRTLTRIPDHVRQSFVRGRTAP